MGCGAMWGCFVIFDFALSAETIFTLWPSVLFKGHAPMYRYRRVGTAADHPSVR
jgi:hypothetical protein